MKSFLKTWRKAKSLGVQLPETDDPDYKSFGYLLYHIMDSSRYYLTWICKNLRIDDPIINEVPNHNLIEIESSNYLEHLLSRWSLPLVDIQENFFMDRSFPVRWGPEYTVEAMLEHAVLHPLRHEYQLKNLIS